MRIRSCPMSTPKRRRARIAEAGEQPVELEDHAPELFVPEDVRGFSRSYALLVSSVDFLEVLGDAKPGLDRFAGDDLTNLSPRNQEDRVAVVLKFSLRRQREVAGCYEDTDPTAVQLGCES